MKVTVAYIDGKVDEFEDSTFTQGNVFGEGNRMSNFTVRADDLGDGLWVDDAWYDYRKAMLYDYGHGRRPGARWTPANRVHLLAADELESVLWVRVDGDMVLRRYRDRIVNVIKLKGVAEAIVPGDVSKMGILELAAGAMDRLYIMEADDGQEPAEFVMTNCDEIGWPSLYAEDLLALMHVGGIEEEDPGQDGDGGDGAHGAVDDGEEDQDWVGQFDEEIYQEDFE